MTVALITEADANPGETGYLAGQLSSDGIKVLHAAGPEITGGSALPNTIITPHIAYNTREAIRRISDITLDNIHRWLRDHGGI